MSGGDRLAVAVGGGAGALLRTLLGLAWSSTTWPWATLTANVTGAFLLGVVVATTARGDRRRLLVGTGLLGAWTTFSALALESVELLGADGAAGLAYPAVTVALGLAAATAGLRLGGTRR